MKTISLIFTTLFLFASLCSAQSVYSNKTTLFPNGLSESFSLDNYIITPPYTTTPLANTSVCLLTACDNSATAYTTTYDSDPFSVVICICDNAVMNLTTIAEKFGKVPYKLRATPVLSITSASNSEVRGASTIGNKSVFFSPDSPIEIFVHEAADVFDANTLAFTTTWLNAIIADSCVPDPFSQTSAVADFAQVVVTWTYYVVSNNANNTPSCIANQLAYVSSLLSAYDILSHLYHPATTTGITTTGSEACSLSISQTITNYWVSGQEIFSQYSVTFTNVGALNLNIFFDIVGDITQYWIVQQQTSTGLFTLPSWLPNGLEPNSPLEWGYTIASSLPATIVIVQPSSCPSNNQSPSCNAQISLNIEQTWNGGGLGVISILNTGTQTISSLSFNLQATNLYTWNTQTVASGSLAPASYSLPILVGAELDNIGFTYSGSVPTLSLVSVGC